MKRLFTLLAVLAPSLTVFAQPLPYYVAGDFNSWDPRGMSMIEPAGSGVWMVPLHVTPGRHEFKITRGDWTWSAPDANSWFVADASGQVTLSYDTRVHADGWFSSTGRIGVSVEPGAWTAVGDWQGWNNANPATAMTALGGGIYEYHQLLAPGTYQYKAVNTGTWDAIGADARSINAANLSFTVDAADPLATFWVNALDGTIKVQVSAVPEPSLFALLGCGLVVAARALRRR